MITPELKSLFSPDIGRPALPLDPEDCIIFVEATIGPKGEESSEIFSFSVVTPKGLAREALPRWGRGFLLVSEFSWGAVEHALEHLLVHARRNSWSKVASVLNQELHWQFENYQSS
jgi:hypothetical protein